MWLLVSAALSLSQTAQVGCSPASLIYGVIQTRFGGKSCVTRGISKHPVSAFWRRTRDPTVRTLIGGSSVMCGVRHGIALVISTSEPDTPKVPPRLRFALDTSRDAKPTRGFNISAFKMSPVLPYSVGSPRPTRTSDIEVLATGFGVGSPGTPKSYLALTSLIAVSRNREEPII